MVSVAQYVDGNRRHSYLWGLENGAYELYQSLVQEACGKTGIQTKVLSL